MLTDQPLFFATGVVAREGVISGPRECHVLYEVSKPPPCNAGRWQEDKRAGTIQVPLFLPLLQPFAVNLVGFGIVTVIAVEIGLLTPALGISVFVIKSTPADDWISPSDIFAGAFPFAVIMLIVLILTIRVPWLSRAFL